MRPRWKVQRHSIEVRAQLAEAWPSIAAVVRAEICNEWLENPSPEEREALWHKAQALTAVEVTMMEAIADGK